jgi:hypothetical protein
LAIVVIAFMAAMIIMRTHLQAFVLKNLAIVVIAIVRVVIVIRPHLQAIRIKELGRLS